ncbi:hypothetical protein JX265_005019 [Neoarthrinium moseri]|uniref:Uncharacterized protein n=1 Tax=Neoarthrinium moseri TaxID=1658444 RepID=A0A9Q0AMY5_9PEZI|nr:hypothetical protein JX265_005019 [Neoarthrinium moseri]
MGRVDQAAHTSTCTNTTTPPNLWQACSRGMELFATGFNAWNQLSFEKDMESNQSGYPADVEQLTRILSRDAIEHLYASLSCTVVKTEKGDVSAGYPDEWMEVEDLREKIIFTASDTEGYISQFQSADHFRDGKAQWHFPGLRVIQTVAYEAGFAALTAEGQVWTWGDERYGACLGREVTEDSPAERPCRVMELDDLPTGKIVKIAAGGYLLMALTEGNDVYAWGGHPGQPAILEEVSRSPAPVVVEDSDIADCAVGESHAVLLTVEGDIFAIGVNTNGQLGLPGETRTSWTKLPFDAEAGLAASAVFCGPRNTFVLARKDFNAS